MGILSFAPRLIRIVAIAARCKRADPKSLRWCESNINHQLHNARHKRLAGLTRVPFGPVVYQPNDRPISDMRGCNSFRDYQFTGLSRSCETHSKRVYEGALPSRSAIFYGNSNDSNGSVCGVLALPARYEYQVNNKDAGLRISVLLGSLV